MQRRIMELILGVNAMTRKDSGYGKKHPTNLRPDQRVLDAVRQRAAGGEISCAVAFDIAEKLKVVPAEVGVAIDTAEISIVKCQLGLFGYQPQKRLVRPSETISQALDTAIRAALVHDRLPCNEAWNIANSMELPKMAVSSACEALNIKISSCQLGAF